MYVFVLTRLRAIHRAAFVRLFSFLETALSIRDSLLAKVANPVTPVEIDGMTVYVRSLSYSQKVALSDSNEGAPKSEQIMAVTKASILACICDENGVPVFTEADWAELLKDPGDTIGKLANAVLKHSGMIGDDAGKQSSGVVPAASVSAPVLPLANSPAS